MQSKTGKHHLFEVSLNWIADTRGMLRSTNAEGTLHVGTPPEFGGHGKPWSPEHFFLSAISSCFMSTFLLFMKRAELSIISLDCNCIGQVELVDGKYKFTQVDVYPRIAIEDESQREKADLVLEKTHKHCLIVNSINSTVYYHTELLVAPKLASA